MKKPIPLLSLKDQYKGLRSAMHAAAQRVLDSGVFILGPEGRDFEVEFAKAQGAPRAVGPADMDPILELARARGLKVIEDCAQAHLAIYKGRPAGILGDIGAFSFYPSKNLGAAGDAGMATTADAALADLCLELRNCGRPLKGATYHHPRVGYNSRLDELQAAVLRVKLKKLDGWTKKRRSLAALYDKKLKGLPLRLPSLGENGTQPVFHLYVLRTERRDELAKHLSARGIGTGVYYPIPVHKQPAYAGLASGSSFPVAEEASRTILALPMFPELTAGEVSRVCAAIRSFFDGTTAPKAVRKRSWD